MNKNTIIAIATPVGLGGIAVLRMSGDQAFQIADKIIKLKNRNKLIRNMKAYTAAYGQVMDNDVVIDDVIVLVFRNPNSYTGEDTVEISCHGGEWVSKEILKICLRSGASMAAPGEFTKRAFLNDKLSLVQAEGVLELISANSTQQAACARAMLSGEKNNRLNQIKSSLMEQITHLSAWMDYPEEEVEEVQEENLLGIIRKNRVEIGKILEEYKESEKVKRGIKAVIVGNPNVGKSTIFNLLLGHERAITTPIPGTTRDVLRDELDLQGYPLFLTDTAGLRKSEDLIEIEGIRRTKNEIEQADILIVVFDITDPDTFHKIKEWEIQNIPKIAIFNKEDLLDSSNILQTNGLFDCEILLSAMLNPQESSKKIKDAMIKVLQLRKLDPNFNLLLNERQNQELENAYSKLLEIEEEGKYGLIYDITNEKLLEVLQALNCISGNDACEEVIEQIFKNFCVGK